MFPALRQILCVTALLTAAVESGDGAVEPEPLRALLQFGSMIEFSTNRNPADYIGYGNWCGFSGSGQPVDPIDRCCMVHDQCYDGLNVNECRWYFNVAPYIAKYDWTVENGTIACNAVTNGKCTYGVCECDRVAADCFSKYPFNPDHKITRF